MEQDNSNHNHGENAQPESSQQGQGPSEFSVWEDVEELNPQLLRGIYAYNFEKPSLTNRNKQNY